MHAKSIFEEMNADDLARNQVKNILEEKND